MHPKKHKIVLSLQENVPIIQKAKINSINSTDNFAQDLHQFLVGQVVEGIYKLCGNLNRLSL